MNYPRINFYLLCVIFFLLFTGLIASYAIIKVHSKRHQPFKIDLENVLAYTHLPSYTRGDSIPVFIHTTKDATAELYRWGATLEKTTYTCHISKQLQSTIFDPFNGFSWNVSLCIPTHNLKSGYYFLKIVQPGDTINQYTLSVIVKPASPPPIAVIASTNTWQSYNTYGGLSNYENKRVPWYLKTIYWYSNYTDYIPPHLPFARPYQNHQDFLEHSNPFHETESPMAAEWNMVAFLESKGYEGMYGVYSDFDLNSDFSILNSDVWVFNVHSEYWSNTMMGMYKRYLDKGGKVIWASGNNMYREIDNYEGGIFVSNQIISSHTPLSLTGTFSFKAEAGLHTFAPYKIVNSKHWVFNDTTIHDNTVFGKYSSLSSGENEYGASGMETDRTGLESDSFQVLATGMNPFGAAHMVFKETPKGGWIFNASSISFSGALTQDTIIDGIVINLIKDAVKK
ncbi:MAG: hypothetical protein EPN85_12515 [Bacteroidetes bacterium]|nr:MAG: hypothetical protein EPN85_12515 [Bacteroidota bacterium]